MYAIVRTGGKQYKVRAGDVVRIEKIDKNLGVEFEITEVLMVGGDKSFVGEPTLETAFVKAIITRQAKAPKVIVFKKKRRQGYRRMQGHRQAYTEIFIKEIINPDGVSSKAKADIVKKAATSKPKADTKKADTKKNTVAAKKADTKKNTVAAKKADTKKNTVAAKKADTKKNTVAVKKADTKKNTVAAKKAVTKTSFTTKATLSKKATAPKKKTFVKKVNKTTKK